MLTYYEQFNINGRKVDAVISCEERYADDWMTLEWQHRRLHALMYVDLRLRMVDAVQAIDLDEVAHHAGVYNHLSSMQMKLTVA